MKNVKIRLVSSHTGKTIIPSKMSIAEEQEIIFYREPDTAVERNQQLEKTVAI